MTHTYFFESRGWKAEGLYYSPEGEAFPLYGEVTIERSENLWELRGFMEVSFAQPARFTNEYKIIQGEGAQSLNWVSFNPALGTLRGSFEIIGAAIISSYRSDDGVYSGTETLIQRDIFLYENFGVSFKDNKKMSSWQATLN